MRALQQGQQSAPAFRIQFAHHIINQQDRRRAVNAGDVFRLRHFQRDGKRAFLAFAAVGGGGFVIQEQLHFVAVRADHGHAIGLLTRARLGEFEREVVLDAGLVFESEFLGVVGDAAIREPGQGREFGNQLAAQLDDFLAERNQLTGKTFQRHGIKGTLFQQCVARTERLRVTLQDRDVRRERLREQQVEETPTPARRAFHELQILGAEDDGAERAEIVREFFHGLAVQGNLSLGHGPIHFDFALALGHDVCADEVALLAVLNHLRAAHAAKRTERGEKVEGFEDVRLALRVVADEDVEARRERHVHPRIIAEVPETQLADVHPHLVPSFAREGKRGTGIKSRSENAAWVAQATSPAEG